MRQRSAPGAGAQDGYSLQARPSAGCSITRKQFRALQAVSTIGYTESVKTLRSDAAAGRRSPARAQGWVWGCLSALLLGACGNQESLGVSALSVVSAGVVNDPANKSLRFDLLKFGLERFCVEMQRRGAPLKLSDSEPVLGRFF